ncbi:MAG: cyclic nucleotide-binding domain-containing protein [bacterium]
MNVEPLLGLPICEGLNRDEVEVLARTMDVVACIPHQRVFARGSEATACFFVLSGEVEITVPGRGGRPQRIAMLGPGALIGEVALIDGGVRSADGVAGPDGAHLARLDRDAFDQVFRAGNRFAYKLLDVIASDVTAKLRVALGEVAAVAASQAPLIAPRSGDA